MKEKTYPQNTAPQRGRPKKIPRKLRSHLQAIANEVTWLNHYHEVFLQFVDIADGSSAGGQSSEFWDFSRWAFFGELVHRVDRITEGQWKDKKRKVNSLGAFLDDIRPYVHLFNRGNYVGSTPNTFEQFKKTHPHKSNPYIPRDQFHRCPVRATPAQNGLKFKSTSCLNVTTPVPSVFFSALPLAV